jgi:hypothetical protein
MASPLERVLAGQVGLGTGAVIASPFQFATSGEDMLRFRLWCHYGRIIGPKTIRYQAAIRSIRADGTPQLTTVDLLPLDGPIELTQLVPLDAGFLQTVSVMWAATSQSTLLGPCYCVVDLVRGTSAGAQLVVGQLLGGYTGPGLALSWPGAPIVSPFDGPGYQYASVLAGDAGVDVTLAVPQFLVWRIRAVQLTFVASAAAAARRPLLRFFANGSLLAQVAAPGDITAGQTWALSYFPSAPREVDLTWSVMVVPIPDGLVLRFGDTITTLTANLQALDVYSVFNVQIEEWIEPLP